MSKIIFMICIVFFFFFFLKFTGLPAGSGGLASQGDQPKKGEKIFFSRLQGFRQDLGFQKLGGTIKKTPQNFFSPRNSGRRALRARLPAGHRVERRRV